MRLRPRLNLQRAGEFQLAIVSGDENLLTKLFPVVIISFRRQPSIINLEADDLKEGPSSQELFENLIATSQRSNPDYFFASQDALVS